MTTFKTVLATAFGILCVVIMVTLSSPFLGQATQTPTPTPTIEPEPEPTPTVTVTAEPTVWQAYWIMTEKAGRKNLCKMYLNWPIATFEFFKYYEDRAPMGTQEEHNVYFDQKCKKYKKGAKK